MAAMEAMAHLDVYPSKIVVFICFHCSIKLPEGRLKCRGNHVSIFFYLLGLTRSVCTGIGYDRKGGYRALATSDWR